jgi:hypothetical protein
MKEHESWAPLIAYVHRMEKALLDIDRWCYEFRQDKNKSNERMKKFVDGVQYIAKDGLGDGFRVAREDSTKTP